MRTNRKPTVLDRAANDVRLRLDWTEAEIEGVMRQIAEIRIGRHREREIRQTVQEYGWDRFMAGAIVLSARYPRWNSNCDCRQCNHPVLHVATDEFGRLWRLDLLMADFMIPVVEVVNSTPSNPTRHFIPVDGQLRPIGRASEVVPLDGRSRFMLVRPPSFWTGQPLTPKNAIASTFGLFGEEYDVGAAS